MLKEPFKLLKTYLVNESNIYAQLLSLLNVAARSVGVKKLPLLNVDEINSLS